MRKKLLFCLLTIILLTGINVHAKGLAYYLSNKDMNYYYYDRNNFKTYNVQRGDVFSVVSVIDSVDANYLLKQGKISIRWDDSAFELVNNGSYYNVLDYHNISFIGTPTVSSNKISFRYNVNANIPNGKSKLFQFNFRVLNNAKTGVYKIYQMDDEDSLICLDNADNTKPQFTCANSYYTEIKYNIEGSHNNYLKNITIDSNQIDGFKMNTFSYNIETEKEKVTIAFTKDDERATVSGDYGTKSLNYGINTFNITVTSESGKKAVYTLNIKRIDTRSKINSLSKLDITDSNINFSPDVLVYDCTVKNEIKEITIKALPTDSKSIMSEDYTNKKILLSEGVNRITIKVTAENGDEKTYVVNITRELSGNNTLKRIEINNRTIEVKENVFNYTYEVNSDVETVTINALPNEKKSIVKIEKEAKLVEGENDIRIVVTAPNGNEVSYHLVVTRKRKLSANSVLSSLDIKDYELNFRKDKFYYDLKINDEDSLQIDAKPEDQTAIVEIEGNRYLINGSIIKINVKAEDGTYTRYFINIEKSAHNYVPIVIILCLLCLTVIMIIIILSSKKKKMDDKLNEALDNSNWQEDDHDNLSLKEEKKEEMKDK